MSNICLNDAVDVALRQIRAGRIATLSASSEHILDVARYKHNLKETANVVTWTMCCINIMYIVPLSILELNIFNTAANYYDTSILTPQTVVSKY